MSDTQDADLIELLNSLDVHNNYEHDHYGQQWKESKIYVDNQGKLKDPFLEGVQQKIKDPRHLAYYPIPPSSSSSVKVTNTKSVPLYVQPTTSSQLNSSLRKSAEIRIPVETHEADEWNDHEPYHSETRVKSLSLRLTGQMRTIRALESQLVQDTSQLAEKDKMIRSMQNRIRFLETKNAAAKPHFAPPIQQNEAKSKILSKINDKISNQYEVHICHSLLFFLG